MKKLFTILILAASIFAASNVSAASIESNDVNYAASQTLVQENPDRALLEMAVDEMQSMLPTDIGMGLTLNEVYLTHSNFVLEVIAPSDFIDLMRLGFKDLDRAEVLESVAADDATKSMLQLCVSAECGFTLIYSDSTFMNQLKITFSHAELSTLFK
ncbi:MAG: hypothetical protein IIX19_07025 [Alistipes sp.]|nr:hypothetical protein [Alistipes sp.]